MKTKKYLLFFLILVVNITVLAFINVNYHYGKNYTSEYILKFRNYNRYIVNEANIPFKYFNKTLSVSSGFVNGGFLNIDEFNISKDKSGDTYLFTGLKYWTMTNEENDYYAISSTSSKKYSVYNAENEFGIRITEYVKEKTKVYGNGSYTNPWVFVKKYQVNIISDNETLGTAVPNSQLINENETAEFSINVAEGYSFNIENCHSRVQSNSVFLDNVKNDITCNLKLIPKSYTLTYDNNSGSGCSTKSITHGSAYGTLCTPTRSNYTFTGWYTAASGGTQVTSSTVATGNATIYARWTANNCTVTYAPGISATVSNLPSTQIVSAGSYITISSLIPATTSYGFNGWSYGGSSYAPNSSLGICNGGNYTLTATWVTNAVAKYPDVKVTVGSTTATDYAYTSGSWGFKSVISLDYQNQTSAHNVCEIDLNTSNNITLSSSGEVFKLKAYIYGAETYQIQWCTCMDPTSCCKSGDIASFSGSDGSYTENGSNYTKTNGYWGVSGISLGHQVSYSKSISKYFRMRGVKGSTYSNWTNIYNSNWSKSSSTGNFSSYCN
ncbi:MAG: InlB B-repeat-containing protein [Tenericutes bacterium]|nr:InlB B-repeat-containing protein [Mycoplasmatota bacterium]